MSVYLVHAVPGVLLGDTDIIALRKPGDLAVLYPLAARRDRQPAATRHRIAGVQGKVEQRQFELVGIDPDRRYRILEFGDDLNARPQRAPQHLENTVDQRGDMDSTRLQLLPPRKGEQAMGQRGASLGALNRPVDQTQQLGVLRDVFAENFEVAENRHQHVVEIVRDAARELAQRFDLVHLVHLRQRGLALAGPFFDPSLEFPVGLFQLRGSFFHPQLKLGIELLQLAAFPVQLGKHPDLGAQRSGTTGTGT